MLFTVIATNYFEEVTKAFYVEANDAKFARDGIEMMHDDFRVTHVFSGALENCILEPIGGFEEMQPVGHT